MGERKLHPSVEEFKKFVKNNPKLIKAVREEKTTWQELFEDWYLFGEEDPRWDQFDGKVRDNEENKENDETAGKSDWLGQVMGIVKHMDPQQIEGYIYNLSQALGAIQGVISQFKGNTSIQQPPPRQHPPQLFSFRKD